jgi:hypothetical protein
MSRIEHPAQPDLFDAQNASAALLARVARSPRFDGVTFEQRRDGERLCAQLMRVWAAMIDGTWHTLPALAEVCGDPQASISARLRDLRKSRFGGHRVERRYVKKGLHEYRLCAVGSGGTDIDLEPSE